MATVNASGTVTGVNVSDDGSTIITIVSGRVVNGLPSFRLTYEFPPGSMAVAAYPISSLVTFAITTSTPVAAPPVPAPDQITSSTSLSSANAPDGTEASVEVSAEPVAEPTAEVPVVTDAPPAAVAQDGFANTDINSVKETLGIGGGTDQGPAPTTGIITPS